jgi:hypothetical protein
MTGEQASGGDGGSHESARPTKWWQWVLVYPGIAIAILGSIPTGIGIVNSYLHDVPFGSWAEAQKQNELWQKNSECLKSSTFTPIRNRDNVEIWSVVCESGDVLLEGRRPSWELPQKRWVAWNEIAPDRSPGKVFANALSVVVSQAHADESDIKVQSGRIRLAQSLMCQRWVGNGLLLQRIATPRGCYDQIVNTYNGWVVSNHPAPCNAQC